MLSNAQLEALKPQPSPYMSGAIGAVANRPPPTKAIREAASKPREAQMLQSESPQPRGATMQPWVDHLQQLTGSISMPTLTMVSSVAPSPAPSLGGMLLRPRVPDPRSRSLVHLENLPARLAAPQMRPMQSLGADVQSAGLGPRGDEDLGEEELRKELLREEQEMNRRVVAPRSLARSATASPSALGRSQPVRAASGPAGRLNIGLLEMSHCDVLHLPTAQDLRKPSLLALVPPEPTNDLLRAQATDKRMQRHGGAPMAHMVKLAPPPSHFSSAASRRASPLEFLASRTDWAGTPKAPPMATRKAAPSPAPGTAFEKGTPSQVAHAVLSGKLAAGHYPPSAAAGYTRRESSTTGMERQPVSRDALFGGREPRSWVTMQAALDEEHERMTARIKASGPAVPYREVSVEAGNFISGKPMPAPPKRSFQETHGVPWLAYAAEGRR